MTGVQSKIMDKALDIVLELIAFDREANVGKFEGIRKSVGNTPGFFSALFAIAAMEVEDSDRDTYELRLKSIRTIDLYIKKHAENKSKCMETFFPRILSLSLHAEVKQCLTSS